MGLTTPKLLEFAKSFYQCDTVKYVPLENDGSSGSAGAHFERTFFFNEVMTPSIYKD